MKEGPFMYKLTRTRKRAIIISNCLYDDIYKDAIQYLSKQCIKKFKYKCEVYNLLDNHLRTSGICNPENHLGKGNQTAKTLIAKSIRDGFLRLEKAV